MHPSELRRAILTKQTDIVCGHLPAGLAVNAAVTVGVWLWTPAAARAHVWALWPLGVVVVTGLRLLSLVLYRKSASSRLEPRHWVGVFAVGAVAQGVVWSTVILAFYPCLDDVERVFMLAVVSAITGGAVIFLSPLWRVYTLYLVVMVVPLSVKLALETSPTQHTAGLLGFVYLCALAYASLKTGRWIADYTAVSLESQALADHLQAANADLERYQTHLENLVEERTRELRLSNEQLQREIQENKDLEQRVRHSAKMEAIGTLAGGVAHDFNNILCAILGYAEMASHEVPSNSIVAECMDQVLRATERARKLVSQILTFSRKKEESHKTVRIASVVEEAVAFLSASIPSTIRLSAKIHPDSGAVDADDTRIHQVVVNLCTNAYQAMKQSGGELYVCVRPLRVEPDERPPAAGLAPGDYVELTVADTGPGIEPSIRTRIFDPFFTTKAVGEGTGMGLSVVHGIVESCGGLIDVESEPGRGAIFRVFFPRIATSPTEAPKKSGGAPTGNERVLFVDDEPAISRIVCRRLSALGYLTTAAPNAAEALALFREAPDQYDILVTDFTMPGMNGTELIREVRGIRTRIPVIVCTGNREASEAWSDEETKDYVVVDKPFRPDDLAVVIRRLMAAPPG